MSEPPSYVKNSYLVNTKCLVNISSKLANFTQKKYLSEHNSSALVIEESVTPKSTALLVISSPWIITNYDTY